MLFSNNVLCFSVVSWHKHFLLNLRLSRDCAAYDYFLVIISQHQHHIIIWHQHTNLFNCFARVIDKNTQLKEVTISPKSDELEILGLWHMHIFCSNASICLSFQSEWHLKLSFFLFLYFKMSVFHPKRLVDAMPFLAEFFFFVSKLN